MFNVPHENNNKKKREKSNGNILLGKSIFFQNNVPYIDAVWLKVYYTHPIFGCAIESVAYIMGSVT